MWLDSDADGCVYDTVDCYHSCRGCDYGVNECEVCGKDIWYGEEHICLTQEEEDELYYTRTK